MPREAVITGIGVVAPAGIGTKQFWEGVSSAQSFITPVTRFDTTKFTSKVAGVVADFDPTRSIDPRIIAQTDRWTHFDLVCAREAIADAQLDIAQEDATRIGAVFAAGTGGNEFGQRQLHLCWEKGPRYVSAYQSIAWFYAASIGQVSITNGVRGYGRNICAEAAGGLIALAHAAKIIQQGLCDVVIVGGSEASIAPYAFTCHQASGLVSSEQGPFPYRPFDATRSGPIIGEGGAVFCIESKEHAQRRNAHVYAEIAGSGQSFDAIVSREPASDGKEYARAMTKAMTMAQISLDDIDWVVCDGLGTQEGDISEVKALQQVFGSDLAAIPASAPKSMLGRLFNGASTVDVAMALLGMQAETILPTVGFSQPDAQCLLDCVPNTPRSASVQRVLVGARGFGGFNAALVLKK
ncbi:actinorhodin polyketide beta-ketoacyl synthase [Ktedonobacter sp. SOSP1-52]|uniref:beta-ketoacyl-[acyl-carrier-protein] synthase family protein n=1 Tax=Ktedonobacter sp. SOSP1-52 TaxID=2778366 RepID=UPI0019164B96|nr:beta-ketoacyl synthase N-terminal-like domain-containing protein [Ktedonobacter sp. SOSP1-52]GHO65469.1 actinorhodin polyketide beta-ketoacyl synthase [Ktedonobacter sp. SOSP1-52]